MRLYNIRFIGKPILVMAGAAFLIVAAGCGRKPANTPAERADRDSSSVSAPAANQDKSGPAPEKVNAPKLEISQEGIKLNWVDNGEPRMNATAAEGSVDELNHKGSLKTFSAEMFDNGKVTTTMTAPSVVYDTEKRTVTATGGVVLKSLDRKTVVHSDWMIWFSKEHRVVGSGHVTVNSEAYNMTGAGFVADTALKTFTVRPLRKGVDF